MVAQFAPWVNICKVGSSDKARFLIKKHSKWFKCSVKYTIIMHTAWREVQALFNPKPNRLYIQKEHSKQTSDTVGDISATCFAHDDLITIRVPAAEYFCRVFQHR